MNTTQVLITAVSGGLVALISGVIAWLIARRTASGRVDTTEATTLWVEGTAMRVELRNEVSNLRAQLIEAVQAITDLNREIRQSRDETARSREETRLSREETRALMKQIAAIHQEVKTSNALTIGALADQAESRRILSLPVMDRSEAETEHLKHVPSSDKERDDE